MTLMAFFFSIIFFVSLFCILHTYIFYPLWMIVFTGDKEQNEIQFNKEDELPTVDILFAAYNEEAVLEGKLESMLKTNYPKDKIRIFVGSDASTDRTNEIVKKFADTNANIHLIEFPGRTGKSGIINALAEKATADIFILTDANVIFFEDTIFNLVKHFKNNDVAQIAANIIKVSPKKEGIASQEMNYIQMENKIKYAESKRWNIVMGAEGGCYAIRKEFYAPVPKNFYMDDFYITMNVLEKGKQVLFEPKAVCNEDVPTSGDEEFKRKVRISIGNFQNLNRYKVLLTKKDIGFAFVSHKVLRWLTPFFIIITFVGSFFLSWYSNWFFFFFAMELMFLLSPAFDSIFSVNGKGFGPIKTAAHFVRMNAALLKGFFKWAMGIESNIWQPTKRSV